MATKAAEVKINTSAIPAELIELEQWCRWKMHNGNKIPIAFDGTVLRSNDPTTWCGFDKVRQFDSIAFVISGDDPFTGIDLDGCIVDGEYTEWSLPILDRFRGIAYCEVSPSGAGVKLLTRAAKPEGARCTSAKFGEGKQQLECYDNRRFWTITSNVVEGFESIGDGQEAVEWLCKTYLSGEVRQTGTKRSSSGTGAPQSLIERAQCYADNCDPASKGNLRNSVFSISGNLHAFVGENGERLTDNEVYFLLRTWNDRNSDKLRDDELREAAKNGRTNGTPPADKPPKAAPALLPIGYANLNSERGEQPTSDAERAPAPEPVTTPAGRLLTQYINQIRTGELPQLIKQPGVLSGIEVCAGLITIIGAPPGFGKTALAMQVMFDALELDDTLRAVVANAETSFDGLLRRELTRMTRIDSNAIRFGDLTPHDLERITKAASELIPRLQRVSVLNDPCNVIQLHKLRGEPPGLLIVDYLQKFAPADKDARQGVNEVVGTLRSLSKLGWAVLCLSATKRDTNGKHNSKELGLSSFRESGEIEYNADSAYVMVDNGEVGAKYIRHVTLNHVKNRHGAKVDKQLCFHMPRMSFSDLPAPELVGYPEFGPVVDVDDPFAEAS